MSEDGGKSIAKSRSAKGAPVSVLRPAGQGLSCTPGRVAFDDARPGLLYVIAISVRNHSDHSRRVRLTLSPEATAAGFSLNFDPPASTAPGLDVRAEVDFQIPDGTPASKLEFNAVLVATSESDTLEIPLYAHRPSPKLQFDALCDLGACVKDGSVSKSIMFQNVGTAPAKFKIIIGDEWASLLLISPMEGVLAPLQMHLDLDGDGDVEMDNEVITNKAGSQQEIHLTLDPKDLGPVRILCAVKVEGQPDMLLDVSAQVVEQKLEFVSSDGHTQLDKVDFGALYFGQIQQFTAILINHGPQTTGYSIGLEIDNAARLDLELQDRAHEELQALQDTEAVHTGPSEAPSRSMSVTGDNQDEEERAPMPINVSPLEGIIGPYAQLPVSLSFEPPGFTIDRGFKKSGRHARRSRRFCANMTIEAADIKQNLLIKIQAKAVLPTVEISQKIMRFGECPCFDRRDLLVSVHNPTELPIRWELSKSANFSCRPTRGSLSAGQTASVVFSFVPSQMGSFKNTLLLTVSGGIQKHVLSLQGSSNSTGQKKNYCWRH